MFVYLNLRDNTYEAMDTLIFCIPQKSMNILKLFGRYRTQIKMKYLVSERWK